MKKKEEKVKCFTVCTVIHYMYKTEETKEKKILLLQ
jgi:hypothetical protein